MSYIAYFSNSTTNLKLPASTRWHSRLVHDHYHPFYCCHLCPLVHGSSFAPFLTRYHPSQHF